MHLKSVVGLLSLLSPLPIAALGSAWIAPSGVQASLAIAPQSIYKTAPLSTIDSEAIVAKNTSNDDDDARDENPDKQDREG